TPSAHPSADDLASLTEAVSKDGSVRVPVSRGRLSAYAVDRPIGKGKFSTVFRARRIEDGSLVALKRIRIFDALDERSRDKVRDAERRDPVGLSQGFGQIFGQIVSPIVSKDLAIGIWSAVRCLREIGLVRRVTHRHIVAFHEAFIDEDPSQPGALTLILVFEFAQAGDLKRQLRKARERRARFDERVVWKYFAQVTAAVSCLHQQRIMHRDLKPANIFLSLDGTVKVGDLGLGRFLSEQSLEAHSKVGTPLYMAPEVLKGVGYGPPSDVWSLGCILYELAMLRSPFKEEGLSLYQLFQKIALGKFPEVSSVYSATLRRVVAAALAVDPAERPSSAELLE
ncbi:Nek7, partial [Symbiodinium sp. KB8]